MSGITAIGGWMSDEDNRLAENYCSHNAYVRSLNDETYVFTNKGSLINIAAFLLLLTSLVECASFRRRVPHGDRVRLLIPLVGPLHKLAS
jgi:hypothetical protein